MNTLPIEYEGETISVALYQGIDIKELNEIISEHFNLQQPIMGFKSTSGTIYTLKYICQNPLSIPSHEAYELVIKSLNKSHRQQQINTQIEGKKKFNNFMLESLEIKKSECKKNEITLENEFFSFIKYLRYDNFLDSASEKMLIDLYLRGDHDIIEAAQYLHSNSDLQQFKDRIIRKLSSNRNMRESRDIQYRNENNNAYTFEEQKTNPNFSDISRPMTSAGGRRQQKLTNMIDASLTSTQAIMIGEIHNLEQKGLLDKQTVSLIKTLILEENGEVFKVLNSFIAHYINETELSYRLQRLSERLSTYIERPSSPLPRKESLISYINNRQQYFNDKEDIALLYKLAEDENEFLISAFDVFESDKDNENLIDTLIRIVEKYKKMGISKNFVTPSTFYEGNLLVNKEQKIVSNNQVLSSESDNNLMASELLHEQNKEETDENDEHEGNNENALENDNLNENERENQDQDQDQNQDQARNNNAGANDKDSELSSLTYDKISEIPGFNLINDDEIGILKGLIEEDSKELTGAYEIYKFTQNSELFTKTIQLLCSSIFEKSFIKELGRTDYEMYKELKNNKNKVLMKYLKSFAENGEIHTLAGNVRNLLMNNPKEFSSAKKNNSALISHNHKIESKNIEAEANKDSKAFEDTKNRISETKKTQSIEKLETVFESCINVYKEDSLNEKEIEILKDNFKNKNKSLINGLMQYQEDLIDSNQLLTILKEIIFHDEKANSEAEFLTFYEALDYLGKTKKLTSEEVDYFKRRSSDVMIISTLKEYQMIKNINSLEESLKVFKNINPESEISKPKQKNEEEEENENMPKKRPQKKQQTESIVEEKAKKKPIKNIIEDAHKVIAKFTQEGFFTLEEAGCLHKSLENENEITVGSFYNYIETTDHNDFIETLNLQLRIEKNNLSQSLKFNKIIEKLVNDKSITLEEVF